jgi:indole-3-glycerol phosphate synthase
MILDRILDRKRAEVAVLRDRFAGWTPPAAPPARRDFRGALRRADGRISLIAEFKRRSPSKGDLGGGRDPVATARAYEQAGAAALSVLCDETFFGGTLTDVTAARAAVARPVLRKDFIIDECQIAESSGSEGPDALLLIAAALDGGSLRSLRSLAVSCGHAVLVEVHDEAELERALESGADIIGINNRDLRTFAVSLETTLRLRPRIPADATVVAESGIRTRDDVARLQDAGVHAMLVGEALMTARDVGAKVRELLGEA